MSWDQTLFTIYTIGMLLAVVLLSRPIRRIMGAEREPHHADRSDDREADIIVATTVVGVALLWPLTLSLYLVQRFVSVSDDDAPDHGTALVTTAHPNISE